MGLAAVATLVATLHAGEPAPVGVVTAPGRVEISAVDASVAHRLAALAEETWRLLEVPLGLPPAFSSPVFVRALAGAPAPGGERFGAAVEAGGVVSVWIRPGGSRSDERRALVRGLLLRLGVASQGAPAQALPPGWLEAAAAEWCETRAEPARLDALRQESERLRPPALAEIWRDAGGGASRAAEVGALWLVTFLQGESTRAGEWPAFLRLLSRGVAPDEALAIAYPDRFANGAERELWWQTGWHHVRRARTLPALDAAASRAELAALTRFVFAPVEEDMVLPLRTVLEHGRDTVVAVELKRRGAELGRLVTALHPFYVNAGLSLAAAFESVEAAPAKRAAACTQFEQDWRDALELETAARTALDALEQGGAPAPGGPGGE